MEPKSEFADPSLQAIVFVMSSGAEVAASHIYLWPADLLEHAQSLLIESGALSQGFSTGLGFIGSFGQVVTHSLLLSVVEGAVGAGMQTKAGTLQEQAASVIQQAAKEKYSVPVRHIANVEEADPSTWIACYRWPNDTKRAFVFGGEKAIQIQHGSGSTRRIIWSAVEQVYAIRE